jgi:hypothetical protein
MHSAGLPPPGPAAPIRGAVDLRAVPRALRDESADRRMPGHLFPAAEDVSGKAIGAAFAVALTEHRRNQGTR